MTILYEVDNANDTAEREHYTSIDSVLTNYLTTAADYYTINLGTLISSTIL